MTMVRRDVENQFWDFHETNPHVYSALVGLARKAKDAGRERIGIRMLWEVMRWEHLLTTVDPSAEWKLNDSYTSRYARLIMECEPDLKDVFETRKLRA